MFALLPANTPRAKNVFTVSDRSHPNKQDTNNKHDGDYKWNQVFHKIKHLQSCEKFHST